MKLEKELSKMCNKSTSDCIELAKQLKEVQERIDKAIEYIENKLEGTRKSLEYNIKQYNAFEVGQYTRDYKLYANILEILEGEK